MDGDYKQKRKYLFTGVYFTSQYTRVSVSLDGASRLGAVVLRCQRRVHTCPAHV